MKNSTVIIFVFMVFAIVLSGCNKEVDEGPAGNQGTEPIPPEKIEQPVELSIYVDLPTEFSDEEIDEYIREPLKKKHPHISIGEIVRNGPGTRREEVITAGNFPDLIYTTNFNIIPFRELSLAHDLVDLAKQNNFDFNQVFQPVTVNNLISLSGGDGQIMGMPFSANWWGTVYNKDLFEKFGVPYPEDLMSYNDALELARLLTRKEDNIQYIGLDLRTMNFVASGLSLPMVDPVSMKANINNEAFRPLFTLYEDLYAIPGYVGSDGAFTWAGDGFTKTKHVAIYVSPINAIILRSATSDVNWDVTTALNFKEAVGTEREEDVHILMMSSTSKHKNAAFQVMALTTSEDVQKAMARNGRIPAALQFSQFENDYMANKPEFKDKNWAGMFKAVRREISPRSEYSSIASSVLVTANKRLATEGIDINTLMRELQEEADAKIEAAKMGK